MRESDKEENKTWSVSLCVSERGLCFGKSDKENKTGGCVCCVYVSERIVYCVGDKSRNVCCVCETELFSGVGQRVIKMRTSLGVCVCVCDDCVLVRL